MTQTEVQQSFLQALRAAHSHPSAHLEAISPRGCDAAYLADVAAADIYDDNPEGAQPLSSRDSVMAFGAYGGTLAGLAVTHSDISTSVIDEMATAHRRTLRDEVMDAARSALGMTRSQADDFFLENLSSENMEAALHLGEVSYDTAARVFETFLKTGDVDWDAAL